MAHRAALPADVLAESLGVEADDRVAQLAEVALLEVQRAEQVLAHRSREAQGALLVEPEFRRPPAAPDRFADRVLDLVEAGAPHPAHGSPGRPFPQVQTPPGRAACPPPRRRRALAPPTSRSTP